MVRCWMKGALGDALHALCAGYNIRWLLRAIARGGLTAAFFVRRTLHDDLTSWLWALLAALQTSLAVLLLPGRQNDPMGASWAWQFCGEFCKADYVNKF